MKGKRIFALIGASVLLAATPGAQSQFPTVGMPEQPVILRTAAATVKVSAIRGLVYPWALTFLPNGDMLVTDTDGPSAARLVFGRDGTLYMAIGAPGFNERAGTAGAAQEPGSYLGKILRLNDDGTIPMDNPFVGRKEYKPEIFALGIRNAIGLTVHPETGEIWETENGPQGGDEVNIIRRGLNYGWPVITYGRAYTSDPEGKRSGLPPPTVQPPTAMEGMVEPVTYYKPSFAIAGLIFYTGDKFPLWKGNLIAGGLVGMQLTRIQFNRQGLETRREAMLTELRQRIRDVRQGPDGLIYATTDMPDGAVLKLEPVAEP